MQVLLSTALAQVHNWASSSSFRLLPLLFLAGPGPLHERAFSAPSCGPFGRANTFSFLTLLLTNRIPLTVPPLHLKAFVFSPYLYPFFYFCLALTEFLYGQYIFLFSSYVLPYFPDYAMQPCSRSPFVTFPIQPYHLCLATSFWHVPYPIPSPKETIK